MLHVTFELGCQLAPIRNCCLGDSLPNFSHEDEVRARPERVWNRSSWTRRDHYVVSAFANESLERERLSLRLDQREVLKKTEHIASSGISGSGKADLGIARPKVPRQRGRELHGCFIFFVANVRWAGIIEDDLQLTFVFARELTHHDALGAR